MSGEKRPITIEDLVKIKQVHDPNISPDGQWVAYVLATPDKKDKGYKRDIWLVPTSGGDSIQLTRSGKDSTPRWSPDGKTLAFVSGRNGKPQIYLLPTTAPGGEPRTLTSAENGAGDPVWSPDGTQIAYSSRMNEEERKKEDNGEKPEPPQDELEGKYRKERKEQDEKERWDPRPVWRIPYRQGTTFVDERYSQIYVIPVDESLEDDAKKPRRLTDFNDNHGSPVWSPDGKTLYSFRTVDPLADEPWRWMNLIRIDVETGDVTRIESDYSTVVPRISPDGRWLAYMRRNSHDTESITHLIVESLDAPDDVRDLTLKIERSGTFLDWSQDNSLIFTLGSEGNYEAYEYDLHTDEITKIVGGTFMIEMMDVGRSGGLALTIATPANPNELYWLAPGSKEKVQLTNINGKFLDEVIVQETHEIWFDSPGGTRIQGWYILPVGYEEGQQYPLALNIHGGPHVMWGPSARTMWHEWQSHAARGYLVFYCNPRGGEGYGEAFTKALHADWGNVAMTDIMAGVDHMIATGMVDEDRMAVTGGSYGGYMTAWIVGHTNRFKSAVTQRGVYNLPNFYGTTDVPLLISYEFDGDPWEVHDKMWQHSPLAYAHNIKTPLLIIHSENDFRVPIEQAEQLFAYVRRSGGTVHMLRYPREGHELSRSGEPGHRINRLTEMVNWFDKYCMPDKGE